MRILLLLLVSAHGLDALSAFDRDNQLTQVTAVEGQAAELPCDVTPPGRGDSLRLVLWYYSHEGTIYTYDTRGHSGASGSHWVSDPLGGNRLHFQPEGQPATLRIAAVSRADSGLYRCRVDYQLSPTQNSRVNLTVIVPPQKPVIYDESGARLAGSSLGPYRVGQTANVTCAAFDGSPSPNVTWWRGGARVGGPWWAGQDGSVRSQLTLGPLTRADHGMRLTCVAAFHPFSSAVSTAVVLNMILLPETVSLLPPTDPLVAGRPVTLTCHVTGSRPAPIVSWRLGSKRLPPTNQASSSDGNGTVSRVTLTPRVADQGQVVGCRATNPAAGAAAIEDTLLLDLQYAPVVSLTARPSEPVLTGQTVRLRCEVQARPATTRVRWRHETSWLSEAPQVLQNGSSEITLSNVGPESAGNYSCLATNHLGTTESSPVSLIVQHVPHCTRGGEAVYKLARGETANVSCSVTSYPEPDSFRWSYNSSDPLSPARRLAGSWQESRSVSYTARHRADFGTLLCWARNALGEQLTPCVYLIQPADVPDPPEGCGVASRSRSALLVRCQPGFDGGARQTFLMEVFAATDHELHANVTAARPRLTATGLLPGHQYLLRVYAVNAYGLSPATTLTTGTLDTAGTLAAHQAGSLVDLLHLTPMVGVLVGVVTALMLTAAIVFGTRRHCLRSQAKQGKQPSRQEQLVGSFNDLASPEDKHDPDLIPQQTDCLDPDEKYMVERLRNSRFPPPPARFTDRSTSAGDLLEATSVGDPLTSWGHSPPRSPVTNTKTRPATARGARPRSVCVMPTCGGGPAGDRQRWPLVSLAAVREAAPLLRAARRLESPV